MFTFLAKRMNVSRGSLFATCLVACICFSFFFAPFTFADELGVQDVAGGALQNQGSDNFGKVIEAGLSFIGNFLLNVASIFTWAGGMLLEGAIRFFVVDMVESAPLPVINAVWAVVRDICNLLFVFGFLYLGFQMIFDPHSAEAKRTLSHIIIGALLVNFSLFFVKVIIDVGNYIAVSIYNAGTAAVDGASIPAAIVQALGISAFWGTGVPNTDPTVMDNLGGWGGVAYYIMAAIFLLVCAFVFAMAALMLVTRFVTLILILMASPILFAGTAFPQTQHFVQELWHKLVTSTLFPSVFLFMMFISVKILDFLKTGIPDAAGNKASALQGSVTFLPVVAFFCGSIFVLIQALQVSRKIAEGGHDAISHLTQHAHDSFRGFMLRNSVGRAGRAAHHSYEAGSAARARGNAFGKAVQWGLDRTIDRGIRHTLHNAETAKFGSHYSLADIEKDSKERDAHRTKHQQEHDTEHAIQHSAVDHPTDPNLKIEMERAIANSSTEQLLTLMKDMRDKPEKQAEYHALIASMTQSQFENVMKKTDDLNDGERAAIRAVRQNNIGHNYEVKPHSSSDAGYKNATPAKKPGKIKDMSAGELESLGFNTLRDYSAFLSSKQIDDLKGRLTVTEHATLKKLREDELKKKTGAEDIEILFGHFKPDELAKVPKDILTNTNAVPHYTPAIFKGLIDAKIDPQTMRTIYDNLISSSGTNQTMQDFLQTPYVIDRFGDKERGSNQPHKSFKKKMQEEGRL